MAKGNSHKLIVMIQTFHDPAPRLVRPSKMGEELKINRRRKRWSYGGISERIGSSKRNGEGFPEARDVESFGVYDLNNMTASAFQDAVETAAYSEPGAE